MARHTLNDTAKILGLSTRTLRRYDSDGRLVALRYDEGENRERMFYTTEMINDYINGTYSSLNNKYYLQSETVKDVPISIKINIQELEKIEGLGSERISFYKIPLGVFYTSEYNILKVEINLNKTNKKYTVCKLIGDYEYGDMIEAFSWEELQ